MQSENPTLPGGEDKMTEEETANKLAEELEKLFKKKQQAEILEMLPIAKVFTPSSYTQFNGQLGNIAIELGEQANALVKHDAAILATVPSSANSSIAKHYFIKGVLTLSEQLLAFMYTEFANDQNTNQLTPSAPTTATPSENHFVNAGVTALDALLTYHSAAHYCNLIETGKITPGTTDAEFAVMLHNHCDVLSSFLKLLAEKLPELTAVPTPPEHVN
jgi:hypothetical protein